MLVSNYDFAFFCFFFSVVYQCINLVLQQEFAGYCQTRITHAGTTSSAVSAEVRNQFGLLTGLISFCYNVLNLCQPLPLDLPITRSLRKPDFLYTAYVGCINRIISTTISESEYSLRFRVMLLISFVCRDQIILLILLLFFCVIPVVRQ